MCRAKSISGDGEVGSHVFRNFTELAIMARKGNKAVLAAHVAVGLGVGSASSPCPK
jgi:hypothetical protein